VRKDLAAVAAETSVLIDDRVLTTTQYLR